MTLHHTIRESESFHDWVQADINDMYGTPDRDVPIRADRMTEVVDNAGLDIKNVADDHLKKLILHSGMYFQLEDVALWTNARESAEFRCARIVWPLCAFF